MFGIGFGPDQNEKNTFGNLESASGFGIGLGESDLSAASTFMRDILSGNATTQNQALAPQISAAKERAQQQKKSTAEFGTRSGGTAATMASIDDATHASITDLIGSLTGSAASGLASMGESALNSGLYGEEGAFGEARTMHDQSESKWNDIFKSAASFAEAGLDMLPAGAGGFADKASNLAGVFS